MNRYKRTKFACYTAYFTMSSVFSLPPVLFMTLREQFGISYTLLGTLVLTNFCTQLGVDLLFTLFSKYFNATKIVRIMPLITTLGLGIYALIPTLFPHFAYGGLLVGTIVFSVAAGLSEVLLSPTIAAIPSDTPGRD
ncbi:MAG: MFS transporter, partial [Clostridia bacterium]|nr:MFS transporter [Clostridia bacterium]